MKALLYDLLAVVNKVLVLKYSFVFWREGKRLTSFSPLQMRKAYIPDSDVADA